MAITSAFQADDAGSIPATRSSKLFNVAHIAQSVEHYLGKVEVTGSIPVMSSSILLVLRGLRSLGQSHQLSDS